MRNTVLTLLYCVAAAISVSACGGGGGGSSSSGPSLTRMVVSGTASAGSLPIASGSSVAIKALDGTTSSTTVNNDGQFSVSDLSAEGPFVMRIDVGNGQFFYAIVPESGSVNVSRNLHAYSDFVARNWFATEGMDIDGLFDSTGGLERLPSESEFDGIATRFNEIIGGVLDAYELNGVDILTESFSNDGTFIDQYLSLNPLTIDDNEVTLTITDPKSMTQSTLLGEGGSPLSVDKELTTGSDDPPQAPTSPRALVAGPMEIVVLWEPAIDDRGVSNYVIYRDGARVARLSVRRRRPPHPPLPMQKHRQHRRTSWPLPVATAWCCRGLKPISAMLHNLA